MHSGSPPCTDERVSDEEINVLQCGCRAVRVFPDPFPAPAVGPVYRVVASVDDGGKVVYTVGDGGEPHLIAFCHKGLIEQFALPVRNERVSVSVEDAHQWLIVINIRDRIRRLSRFGVVLNAQQVAVVVCATYQQRFGGATHGVEDPRG